MVLYHFSYSSDLLRVISGMSALRYFRLYERLMVSESFISEGKVAPGGTEEPGAQSELVFLNFH